MRPFVADPRGVEVRRLGEQTGQHRRGEVVGTDLGQGTPELPERGPDGGVHERGWHHQMFARPRSCGSGETAVAADLVLTGP